MPLTYFPSNKSFDYLKYLGKRAAVSAEELIGLDQKTPAEADANQRAIAAGKKKPYVSNTIPVFEPAVTGLYDVAKLASTLPIFTHEPNIPALEKSSEKLRLNHIQNAKEAGIDPNPHNAVEVAADVLPALIGPSGKGQAITRGSSYLTKIPKAVGKTVVESVLPLAQGGIKTRAVGGALPIAATELIDDQIDKISPEHGLDYTNMLEGYKKANGQPTSASNKQYPVDAAGTPLDEMPVDAAGTPLDLPENVATDPAGNPLEITDAQALVPASDREWDIGDTLLLGAGALALVGAGRYGRSALKALADKRLALRATGQLVNDTDLSQQTDIATNIVSGIAQPDQALRVAVRKDNPALAKDIEARLDTTTNIAIGQKTKHALMTGELPRSNLSIGNVAARLEAYTHTLSPDDQYVLSRGMLAKTALDQINVATAVARKSNPAAATVQTMFNDYTPAELQVMADLVTNNPALNKVAEDIKYVNRQLADYMEEQGRISAEQKRIWLRDQSNYVHTQAVHSKSGDTSFFGVTSNKRNLAVPDEAYGQHRALDDAAGLQASSDPFTSLPAYIHEVIMDVEKNGTRRAVLEALENKPLFNVKRVEKPGKNTVPVYIDGKKTYFDVNDDALRAQLELNPTLAANIVAKTGRIFNNIYIRSQVGRTLNPFFAITSGIYSGWNMPLTRRAGTQLGLINEALSKVGLNIGALDPTGGVLSIPSGSLRYLIDSGIQQFSHELTQSLFNHDHILASVFPDQTQRQALADTWAAYFANTYKAQGMKHGVFDSHVYDDFSTHNTLSGAEDLTPELARQAASNAPLYSRTQIGKLVSASKIPSVQFNTNKWTRLVYTLQNSIRNGATYSAYATNKSRFAEQEHLASVVRRLGGDTAFKGGNEGVKTVADLIPFFNNAVQPLAEMGRAFKENPVRFTTNFMSFAIPAIASQWLMAAHDPEVRQQMLNDTPDQAASKVYTPIGTMPLDQPMRLFWGMLVPVLNEVSGLNEGNFDPNFLNAIERLIDDGLSEETEFKMGEGVKAGFISTNPLSIASSPLIAGGAALAGFDLQAGRHMGKPVIIGQNESTEEQKDAAITEKFISSLVAGTLNALVNASVDFNVALGHGEEFKQALKVGMSRLKDKAATSSGLVEQAFYKNYEKLISYNDGDTRLMFKKREGIDEVSKVFNEEVRANGFSSLDPKFARLLPDQAIKPEYYNTEVFPVGVITYKLQSELRDTFKKLAALRDVDKAIQDRDKQWSTTIEQRNAQRNALLDERKALTDYVLYKIQQAEEQIRFELDDPSFSYRNFDFEAHAKRPWPPQQLPPSVEAVSDQ